MKTNKLSSSENIIIFLRKKGWMSSVVLFRKLEIKFNIKDILKCSTLELRDLCELIKIDHNNLWNFNAINWIDTALLKYRY